MKSPFKFLDSYTREDRAIFFGRDQEITELYRRVFESKMLLVYGISGTGKSSLVNCGLASRFDESDWLPVNVRRGNNIIDSLNDAFNKQALTPLKKNQSISEKLQSIYLDHFKPVYLLFDQFEELFIFGSEEERTEFISIVKEITESETQCRIIFIIREEFLAGMTEFEEKLPDIFTNRFRVEKMKRANAISAVEGPCKVFGIETEQGFSEQLIEKLCSSGNEIELTYLQIYLDRIFRLALSEQHKTLNAERETLNFSKNLLTKAGSVSDLLGQFLDEQIREMDDPEMSMSILKSFVSIQGTKRQMTEQEILEALKSFGTEISEDNLAKYLNRFVDLRILREKDEAEHYELRHDALADKIYEKFTALEKDIIEVRQFIENRWHDWEKRSSLLSNDDLEYIAPYENRLYLQREHINLIERSKRQLILLKRRQRNIIATATIALLVTLAGFSVWALKERNKATAQSKHSKVLLLISKAREASHSDPTKAIRYAQLAYIYDSTNALANKSLSEIFYSASSKPFYSLEIKDRSGINDAILSPDGKTILTCSNDNTARLWDLSGKCLSIFQGHKDVIYRVLFSPDGNSILTVSSDNTLKLWDLSGKCTSTFFGNKDYIYTASFSPDGQSIISASNDYTVRLWNLSGKCQSTFYRDSCLVYDVKFAKSGILILTSCNNNFDRVELVDLTGKPLAYLKGHSDFVQLAFFSPDGEKIITSSRDNTLKLWDLTGKCLTTFIGHTGNINYVNFSNDGKYLITASDDKTAKLWDLSGKCLMTFSEHSDNVSYACFSPNDSCIVTTSNDKTVKLWDRTGKCLATLLGHIDYIDYAVFSSDGKYILTLDYNNALVWEPNKDYGTTFYGHSDRLFSANFSPNGKKVVTASLDSTVKVWDLSGKCLATLTGHSGRIFSAVFSPNSEQVLTSSEDKTTKLWDLSENCLTTFSGHSSWIMHAEFSPDGKYVLTGSLDNTARLWDLTGKCLDTLAGHDQLIYHVAFSHDGKKMLTSSYDNTVKMWDLTGRCITTISGNKPFYSAVFSPNDEVILTSSSDEAVRFWDLSGKCISTIPLHIKMVFSANFSPDGETILTCGGDKTAKLWDLDGECLATLTGHKDAVINAVFAPDGTKILTASWDKTAKLFFTPSYINKWINNSNIGILTPSEKAEIDEKDNFDELLLSDNASTVVDYAEWYLSIWDTVKATLLYEKAIQINPRSFNKRILGNIYKQQGNADKYIALFKDEPQVIIEDSIITMVDTSANSNYQSKLNYYIEKAILYERLLELDSSNLNKYDAAENYNSIAWYGLLTKDFKKALKAVMRGIELNPSNEYLYSNLTLCYLLTNQYEKAESLYLEYMEKPWSADNTAETYKDIFLGDIKTLEKAGISHPDFEKVKELLKK